MIDLLAKNSPFLYLTQSLWRDEAFSVLLSEHSIPDIIKLTAGDFNPPLYYLILHFWMKLFGNGEIVIRMLSFIFHFGLVYISYKFIKKIFKSSSSSFQLLISSFVFLNPMLLYYGFEARMYSLLALLATASMYFFYCKKWKSYIIVSAIGLWTQPFMVFIILSQIVYWFWSYSSSERSESRSSTNDSSRLLSNSKSFLLSLTAIFLLFLPWIPVVFLQLTRSGPMWIWPVNMGTPLVILGSLLTGYEGTPGGLWGLMGMLSVIILISSFWLVQNPDSGCGLRPYQSDEIPKHDQRNFVCLLLLWLFLPVILVLMISFFKPIYVARYLIFVAVAEVFVIIMTISLLKNRFLRWFFLFSFLIFNFSFNTWLPPLRGKQDIRSTMQEINLLKKPHDFILSKTPLTFFEVNYYAADRDRVFLYNPQNQEIPVFVGKSLISYDKIVYNKESLFKNKERLFLIYDDASFEVIFKR